MIRIGSGGPAHRVPPASPLTLGFATDCEVVLEDHYVSGRHCALAYDPSGALLLRDLGSKNGTFVDGNRVQVAELARGQVITIGATRIVVDSEDSTESPGHTLIGDDPGFRRVVDTALRAARSDCPILLLGETGTGKDLLAQAIHRASRRSAQPFVAINMGAIPGELVSSELFGHERGAFTGADRDQDGVFQRADGGTLFLDELGELPLAQQPHLLRALESRMVRKVGGALETMVDVRIISATHRDPFSPVSTLRADLFHRLSAVVVEVPPLRQRRGDIPGLARAFLGELRSTHGPLELAPAAIQYLSEQGWPGNIRELRQRIHGAAALADSGVIRESALRQLEFKPKVANPGPGSIVPLLERSLRHRRIPDDELRSTLRDAYRRYGSVRRAAAALGMPKSTFSDAARRLGVKLRRQNGG